ncbi:MAG: NAD(P)-dependent oxidoreductase, partial [Dehalococcoidia bacterium]
EEQGATWAESPKEVAQASEIILSSLPGPPEVEEVALGPDGIIEGIRPGSVYIDLSSISPNLARRMYGAFAEKGAHVLDSPVSGGEVGATNRRMVLMVGGDEAVYERCRPLLEHLGDKVVHTGPIGTGSVCKLVHNSVSAATRLAVVEGFTLGVKAGVDPMKMWRAVRWGMFGRNASVHGFDKNLFIGKFDPPSFALKLMSKDVSLAMQLARECQVPMSIIGLAEQELLEAMARGWGDRDSSAAEVLQEERAGIQVRIPDFVPE